MGKVGGRPQITQITYTLFLDKLESEGKEDWQIRQAYRAIKYFLEDFMCLSIDFSENPEDESSGKPVKNPATLANDNLNRKSGQPDGISDMMKLMRWLSNQVNPVFDS
ncbi:MAG: hypothetical protein AUJ48_03920 [Deltaproteobacteria bacterium CG1_02_45_11]|nr:MAG: hypothetical protein AUJ48_03920 [Deltaproteobacteria bacterium CG1_02_45_11]